MTWWASNANRDAADAAHAEVVSFVELDLPSGYLRLHTRTGTVTWGGNSFLGVGKLGVISEVTEDAQFRPSGITLTLSGVDSALLTAALTEKYHGRLCRVWKGLLDVDTFALVADPQLEFRGLMDFMKVSLGANSATITVTAEGENARWQRHQGLMYTHESQQLTYPGDNGLDQVMAIQSRKIDWSKQHAPWQSFGQQMYRLARSAKFMQAK